MVRTRRGNWSKPGWAPGNRVLYGLILASKGISFLLLQDEEEEHLLCETVSQYTNWLISTVPSVIATAHRFGNELSSIVPLLAITLSSCKIATRSSY